MSDYIINGLYGALVAFCLGWIFTFHVVLELRGIRKLLEKSEVNKNG